MQCSFINIAVYIMTIPFLIYMRQRKVFAPYGISFTRKSMAAKSPTDDELANGTNWELVNNGKAGSAKKTIKHKAIPIARIISRG